MKNFGTASLAKRMSLLLPMMFMWILMFKNFGDVLKQNQEMHKDGRNI